MDCSLSGSSTHGIFQARVLEWIAISFSRGSSWPRNRTRVSRIAGRRFTAWATREALLPILKFQVAQLVKNPPANAGDARDASSIPGLGRSPGVGNGNPFWYSCLENSMDRRSLVGYSAWGRKEPDPTEHEPNPLHSKVIDISPIYSRYPALYFHM